MLFDAHQLGGDLFVEKPLVLAEKQLALEGRIRHSLAVCVKPPTRV